MAIRSLVVAELVVSALSLPPEQLNAHEVWSVRGILNQQDVVGDSCISAEPSSVDCCVVKEDGDLLVRPKVLSHLLIDDSHVFAKEGVFLVGAVHQANLLTDDATSFDLLNTCPSFRDLKWSVGWCPVPAVVLLRREAGFIKLADDETIVKESLHVCLDGSEQFRYTIIIKFV